MIQKSKSVGTIKDLEAVAVMCWLKTGSGWGGVLFANHYCVNIPTMADFRLLMRCH